MTAPRAVAPALLLALILRALPAAGQSEPLQAALELYWNGEYSRTLESLNGAALEDLETGERVEAHKYRALSLVALERNEEARGELTALLDLDPGHTLDPTMVPPKVVELFDRARRDHAAERFQEAKAAYGAGEFQQSLEIFEHVLRMEPGMELAEEYRQLALARLDLAARAAEVAPAPTPEPAPDPDRVHSITSDITPPELLEQVQPVYPEVARRFRIGGEVVLTIVVERDGSVREARVLRSVSRVLDAAAIDAVRRWRFRPALMDGRPVAVYKVVFLRFVP